MFHTNRRSKPFCLTVLCITNDIFDALEITKSIFKEYRGEKRA